MLIESLIRLGKPFLSDQANVSHRLELSSDVTDEKARNFLQRVFVVEIGEIDGQQHIRAHPFARWGHMATENGKSERFVPDKQRAMLVPFTIPRGNPRRPQGHYALPSYIVYDKDFEAFRSDPDALANFLASRASKTQHIEWTDELIKNMAQQLTPRFAAYEKQGKENQLAVIVVADTTNESGIFRYKRKDAPLSQYERLLCSSALLSDTHIVVQTQQLLEAIVHAQMSDGAERGVQEDGTCVTCGANGRVTSIYSRAWPWFSITWRAPFPNGVPVSRLVEGIGLCGTCYSALNIGARLFDSLTQRLPMWLTRELFSPVASIEGKEQAKQRQQPGAIFGTVTALPVLDEFLVDENEQATFANNIFSMRESNSSAVQKHLNTITGFEARLPIDLIDDTVYRLTLHYFSGDVSRGDIALRAVIEDVMPAVAVELADMFLDDIEPAVAAYKNALQLDETKRYIFTNLPSFLTQAYGAAYLWSVLADVLHRRPLNPEGFVRNSVQRMQELSKKLPDSHWQLQVEVLFYLSFWEFLRLYHQRIAQTSMKGRYEMKPWTEIHEKLRTSSWDQLDLSDVEELGFVSGHLTRQFSRWYYQETGRDFLKHRVLTFGSSLNPDIVWQRALSMFHEYRIKVWQEGIMPKSFEMLNGIVLNQFAMQREHIQRRRNEFMAAFWSGYALEPAYAQENEEGNSSS